MCGLVQTQWDGIFNGNVMWRYLRASAHFTSTSNKTHYYCFGDLLPVNGWFWWIRYIFLPFWDWAWPLKTFTPFFMYIISVLSSDMKFPLKKIEIHNLQVHPWSLLKLFAMPLCINVSVSNYKFCCETLKVCKVIKQHVHLTPSYQKECPTFELASSVCSAKKASYLMLKHSHGPRRKFCRPQ